jgi:hypothetical protein
MRPSSNSESRLSKRPGLASGSEQVANTGQVWFDLFFSSGSGKVGFIRGKVGLALPKRFRNASEALPVLLAVWVHLFFSPQRRGDAERTLVERLGCCGLAFWNPVRCSAFFSVSPRLCGSISTNEKSPRAGSSGGGLRSDTAEFYAQSALTDTVQFVTVKISIQVSRGVSRARGRFL